MRGGGEAPVAGFESLLSTSEEGIGASRVRAGRREIWWERLGLDGSAYRLTEARELYAASTG
jgi:hypothetical protein